VRTVYSAADAYTTAIDWKPHAMLLDIGLPDTDGYALARRLREQKALAGTFLIALTGYGQSADKERAREAGFDDHVVKPADIDHLLRVLRKVSR